ncbi:MAG: hypothetical protein SF029_11660 [bacterium]|nr:hypothetical protein [bacterium]
MVAFLARCRVRPLPTLLVALLLSLSLSTQLLQAQEISPDGSAKNDPAPAVADPIVAADPPANDAFANAVVIGALPYSATQSTVEATTAGDDPTASCGSDGRARSVWYRYTPAASGTFTLRTTTSNYDTVVSIWTGSQGSLTLVPNGCNDDPASGARQAVLEVALTAGTTYHIMVARFGAVGNPGGTLNFSVRTGAINDILEWQGPPAIYFLGQGIPTYSWSNVGASSYALYIANAATPQSPIYFAWGLTPSCSGTSCTFIPFNIAGESVRLYNGTYVAWVRGTGGWVGPYQFVVNLTPPPVPTYQNVTELNTTTPRFEFGINPAIRYVHLVIWPAATFPNNPVFDQWFYRDSICNGADACGYRVTTPLVDNTTYVFGVQGYGVGGYSTGGNFGGWAGTTFTIDTILNPPIPSGLSVNIGNGTPELSWTSSDAATRHFVAVYSNTTNAFVYGAYHEKIGDPALVCVINACTLVTDALQLPNGSYSFYVNAEGPGGASTGGTFNNGFAGPGDWTYNLPAPVVANITNLNATPFGSYLSFSFTGDPHTTSYNVWVGTAGGAQVFGFQNISAYDLTCHLDQTCVGTMPLFSAIPSGTQFYLAVQGVGPGGSSTGGPVSNGYQVSTAITAP